MKVDKMTSFEDYVSRLKYFVEDCRSENDRLLWGIEMSRKYDKSTLEAMCESQGFDVEEILKDEDLFSYFSDVYFHSGLTEGNYQMFLHGDSNLFEKVLIDFKKNPLWDVRLGNDEHKSQPFISENLGMYMQIQNIDKYFYGSPADNMKDVLLIDGNYGRVQIIFPGVDVDMFNPPKDKEFFYFKKNMANTIVSISDYIIDNKIPSHIYLPKKPYSDREEDELIVNNPNNSLLEFSDKEIGYKKNY